MAATAITEQIGGLALETNTQPITQYKRKLRVYCEDGDSETTAYNALTAAGYFRGAAHPRNSLARLQSINLKQVSNEGFRWTYDADLSYSTLVTAPPPGDEEEADPTLRVPKVSWGREFIPQPMNEAWTKTDGALRDITQPLWNSAYDPFDPVPNRDYSIRVLDISLYLSSFNASFFWEYENHVNRTAWQGFPKETVLFDQVTAESEWNASTSSYVWKCDFRFKVDPNEWILDLLDIGYRGFDGNGQYVEFTDDDGNRVSQPELLDGNGQRLEKEPNVTPTPVHKQWYLYPRKEFAELGIVV